MRKLFNEETNNVLGGYLALRCYENGKGRWVNSYFVVERNLGGESLCYSMYSCKNLERAKKYEEEIEKNKYRRVNEKEAIKFLEEQEILDCWFYEGSECSK